MIPCKLLLAPRWRLLVIVLLSLAFEAAAARASRIIGTIAGADTGEPLPYVNVLLNGETPTGGIIRTGQASDEQGRFEFPDVVRGTYQIRFLYIGYKARVDTIRVVEDRDYTLNVVLEVEPIEVNRIVVEAPRIVSEVDASVIQLDIKALNTVPAIGEPDPIRSLQFLPGVQTASDISSGLYVRGGGPDQTLVMLDRVTVYNPTHAFGLFSTFNADAIGGVKLYKGAYPADYGGRLGAVLDVASRGVAAPKISGTAGISTIASRLTLEGPLGQSRWLLSGRRTYLEPFLNALSTPESPLPSYYFYDLNGKLTAGKTTQGILNGYHGRDDISFELDADSFIGIKWGNSLVSGAVRHFFRDNLLGEIAVSGSEYISDTNLKILNTDIKIFNRLRDYSVRGDLDWTLSKHRIGVGLQASSYDFEYAQEFNRDPGVGFKATPYEFATYLDDRWRPFTGTSIRPGLRVRYVSDGERTLFEPRLAASQLVGGGVRLKIGGGVYNQFLQLVSTEGFSAADFYLPIDETARMAQSWQAVLGADWLVSRQYEFSIEGYYTRLENLVTLDNTNGDNTSTATVDVFRTDGEGYATGAEFFIHKRTGALTGWVGYTLGWTRRRFEELNQGERYPPKYDRRHDVSAVASYRRNKWIFGGALIYATGQAFTPAAARYRLRDPAVGFGKDFPNFDGSQRLLPAARNSARLLPYHRVDVSVTRRFSLFGLPAEGVLQIFNLYSRRNEWFIQYDTDNPDTEPVVTKQLPIIPSLGVNFKF